MYGTEKLFGEKLSDFRGIKRIYPIQGEKIHFSFFKWNNIIFSNEMSDTASMGLLVPISVGNCPRRVHYRPHQQNISAGTTTVDFYLRLNYEGANKSEYKKLPACVSSVRSDAFVLYACNGTITVKMPMLFLYLILNSHGCCHVDILTVNNHNFGKFAIGCLRYSVYRCTLYNITAKNPIRYLLLKQVLLDIKPWIIVLTIYALRDLKFI